MLPIAAQVAGLGLGARVSVRHWVDDDLLASLYAHATAFAFPSKPVASAGKAFMMMLTVSLGAGSA